MSDLKVDALRLELEAERALVRDLRSRLAVREEQLAAARVVIMNIHKKCTTCNGAGRVAIVGGVGAESCILCAGSGELTQLPRQPESVPPQAVASPTAGVVVSVEPTDDAAGASLGVKVDL